MTLPTRKKARGDVPIEKPMLENADVDGLLHAGDDRPGVPETAAGPPRPSRQAAAPGSTAAELMPQSDEVREILRRRAADFARDEEHAVAGDRVPFIRLRLGPAARYGVPFANLEEIVRAEGICRIPLTPEYISGVINWRGRLLTVIDAARLFDARSSGASEDARIAVVSRGDTEVGILVDAVESDDSYRPGELAPSPRAGRAGESDYVLGIHSGKVAILDIEALLGDGTLTVSRGERG